MMDLKRILELAVDGARANWLDAIDALRRNPSSKNMLNRDAKEAEFRQINKLQQSYEMSMTKDNFQTDQHSALHETYDKIESIRNSVSASEFVPEYIVRIEAGDDVREFRYATSKEARAKFNQKKRIAEVIPEYYHIQLFGHIRKGQTFLIDEAGGQNAANAVGSRAEYQILITHKSGDIQTLHFDDIRAAKAAFELMKYELKANRIIYANLLYCISDTLKKQLDYANRMTVAKEA